MKHIMRRLMMIALVAVIGFSFAACGNGGGGNGGNGNGGNGGNGGGGGGGSGRKLTITGLPSGGDWEVYVLVPGTDISTITAISRSIGLRNNNKFTYLVAFTAISGNVFNLSNNSQYQPWSESGSQEVALINRNGENPNPANSGSYYATVNFSNGSATVPFSNFTAVTQF